MEKEQLVKENAEHNIYNFIGNERRIFVIPPFQRNYDWNSDTCNTF